MSDVIGEQERTSGITDALSEQSTHVSETGRRQLQEQLDERTTQVGRQARSLAEALRRSGQSLRTQGGEDMGVERITAGVADRLDRAGGYLERAQGDEMLRDAERFVRERPWLVTSAAAAAGLIASRVFKASSESRYLRPRTRIDGSEAYPDVRRGALRADDSGREHAAVA
jgi:ElaB/YqjD/DUF883 family membrane-anchored ribosome-binding protein